MTIKHNEPAGARSICARDMARRWQVADGFWLLATRHRPGLSRHMFEINNRCLVFRLQDQRPGLPGAGWWSTPSIPCRPSPRCGGSSARPACRSRYVVSPGGGHHLQVEPWHDAVHRRRRCWFGPVRVPRTAHGRS